MKLRRERDALDAPEPAVETLSGPCPLCNGGGGSVGGRCHICDGRGRISYPKTWSIADDDKLRELVGSGLSIYNVAIRIGRPISIVFLRMALLGIESPRPEPDAFFHVRTRDGRDVDLHDPAFQETAP